MRRSKAAGPGVTRSFSCEGLVWPCGPCGLRPDRKGQRTPAMLAALERPFPLGHATDLSPLGAESP